LTARRKKGRGLELASPSFFLLVQLTTEAVGLHLRASRPHCRPMDAKAHRTIQAHRTIHAGTKEAHRTIHASTTDTIRANTMDRARASMAIRTSRAGTGTSRARTMESIRASTRAFHARTTESIRVRSTGCAGLRRALALLAQLHSAPRPRPRVNSSLTSRARNRPQIRRTVPRHALH